MKLGPELESHGPPTEVHGVANEQAFRSKSTSLPVSSLVRKSLLSDNHLAKSACAGRGTVSTHNLLISQVLTSLLCLPLPFGHKGPNCPFKAKVTSTIACRIPLRGNGLAQIYPNEVLSIYRTSLTLTAAGKKSPRTMKKPKFPGNVNSGFG